MSNILLDRASGNAGKLCLEWSVGVNGSNCGLNVVYGFKVRLCSGVDTWGNPGFLGVGGMPPLTLEEVYKAIKDSIATVRDVVGSTRSIVIVSDKVCDAYPLQYNVSNPVRIAKDRLDPADPAYIEQQKDVLKVTEYSRPNVSCTAMVMRAIRESKCGMLISSPIVENPNHKCESGIVAGLWILRPDRDMLDDRIGISGRVRGTKPEKGREVLEEAARKSAKTLYGR